MTTQQLKILKHIRETRQGPTCLHILGQDLVDELSEIILELDTKVMNLQEELSEFEDIFDPIG